MPDHVIEGPLAGQCQFSSIAELLVDNNESIRLDSMLRLVFFSAERMLFLLAKILLFQMIN